MKRIIIAMLIALFSVGSWSWLNKDMGSDAYLEIVNPGSGNCLAQDGTPPKTTLTGDFDGDTQQDEVKLIQKGPFQQFLVFLLSSRDRKPMELDATLASGSMGIKLAQVGDVIQSACARGFSQFCDTDEPVEVKLKTDAIWLAACESSASVLFWNSAKAQFDRIWYNESPQTEAQATK
jgi:hypothetical protein